MLNMWVILAYFFSVFSLSPAHFHVWNWWGIPRPPYPTLQEGRLCQSGLSQVPWQGWRLRSCLSPLGLHRSQNSTFSFLPRALEGSPHLGCWFQTQRRSHQYQSPRCPGALQPLFGILRHSPKSEGKRDLTVRLSGLWALKMLDSESRILCWCESHLFNFRPTVSVLGLLVTGENTGSWKSHRPSIKRLVK